VLPWSIQSGIGRSSLGGGSSDPALIRPPLTTTSRMMRWPSTVSICADWLDDQPANAGEASSVAAVIDVSQILPNIAFSLRGRREGRPHRRTGHRVGFEPEVFAQAELVTGTIAGGAWSPAVAGTVRCILRGRCGLSERGAGSERNQRERGDKGFHDASPLYGRRPLGPATATGRRPVLSSHRGDGAARSGDKSLFGI
jgi:hypothetical protein